MSNDIGQKIRMIREAEGLSREDFCLKIGVKVATLTQTEMGRRTPSSDTPLAVCQAFPQYTLWLMTGQVAPEAGQISPDLKATQERLKTGT